MKALFILNSAPYGSEHLYSGLRLAGALAKRAHNEVRLYLMGDGVGAAKAGQIVPPGFYNLQLMLDKIAQHPGANIGVCASCMDARGLTEADLAPSVHRGSLEELADWSEWADKVFVF